MCYPLFWTVMDLIKYAYIWCPVWPDLKPSHLGLGEKLALPASYACLGFLLFTRHYECMLMCAGE